MGTASIIVGTLVAVYLAAGVVMVYLQDYAYDQLGGAGNWPNGQPWSWSDRAVHVIFWPMDLNDVLGIAVGVKTSSDALNQLAAHFGIGG